MLPADPVSPPTLSQSVMEDLENEGAGTDMDGNKKGGREVQLQHVNGTATENDKGTANPHRVVSIKDDAVIEEV